MEIKNFKFLFLSGAEYVPLFSALMKETSKRLQSYESPLSIRGHPLVKHRAGTAGRDKSGHSAEGSAAPTPRVRPRLRSSLFILSRRRGDLSVPRGLLRRVCDDKRTHNWLS